MMIKNLFKYSQAIVCMALALSFNACTDEVDRDPSPVQTEGVQAYFYQDAQTSFDLIPDDAQVVQVTVGRNSTGAASVQLTGDNDIFTFPSTVDFQEGETSKAIDVAFDIWTYAEVGYKEFKSSKRLCDCLREEGFKVNSDITGLPTAFFAEYGSGRPIVAFWSEYDALPGLSQKVKASKEPLTEGAYMINTMQSALACAERVYQLLDEEEISPEPEI